MTQITLETTIKAPIDNVFNLSRDIDFHKKSASQTSEEAIEGVTSGLINLGEEVLWRGKHFGIYLQHRSKITQLEFPVSFTDEMVKGRFTYFKHEHRFRESDQNPTSENYNTTIMTDILTYSLPLGIIGKVVDALLIKNHLTKFLKIRNNALKKELEY